MYPRSRMQSLQLLELELSDALYFRAGPPRKNSTPHQATLEVDAPDAPVAVVGVPQCGLTARPLGPLVRPTENGFIESFNGRLRDECLNVELFASMADATRLLVAWRDATNRQRPHSSLGDDTPAEFATKKLEGTVPSRRQESPAGEAGFLQCVN